MRLDDLQMYNMPDSIIDVWRQRQGERLLPVQAKAVRRGLLVGRGEVSDVPVRMIISSPTSSGKSFCAEMGMVRALLSRQKTVILAPLRSLVTQKYKEFCQTYAGHDIEAIIVSSDHPENDTAFMAGNYKVAFAIYEKFDHLLTMNLDALQTIGLIVIDEIQTIAEPGRGPLLERLLTKLQASVYHPSIIGLSAVIGDSERAAGRLANWLDATLVETTTRPLDLIRGVAAEGTYKYRSFNDHSDGSKPFFKVEAGDDPFEAFVEQLRIDDGSTLVFLKSRHDTVNRAIAVASKLSWPPATKAIEQLAGEEPSFLIRSLRQAMSRGVAFHNSDLSTRQREIVERAFISKEVRAIFSTTTLAMGVNLSADTVYLETVKHASGEYGGSPGLVPVSRAEFENMAGRAGRLGSGTEQKCGRAIVLAESEFDREILWQSYIATDQPDEIKSAFTSMPLEDWLLNMITSSLVRDRQSLNHVYSKSLAAAIGQSGEAPDFDRCFERLVSARFVSGDLDEEGTVCTPFGQAIAASGLTVGSAIRYKKMIQQTVPTSSFGWIAFALGAPDLPMPPGILTRYELSEQLPMRMFSQREDLSAAETGSLLENHKLHQPLSRQQAASLKAAMLVYDWSEMVPLQELEEKYQMHLGQIMSLADAVGHRLFGLANLMEVEESSGRIPDQLREVAFAARYGIEIDLASLRSRFGNLLNRRDFSALKEAGITSVQQFVEQVDDLGNILGHNNKLDELKEQLQQIEKESVMNQGQVMTQGQGSSTLPFVGPTPESIEIIGSCDRERFLVKINGFPVPLTGKSFKYFTRLAWSRLHRTSGWLFKEDLEAGFNQARYLYRMKNEIFAGLNINWPILENNRLGYYRLNVDPVNIRLNVEVLKNHPDFEVRSLFHENSRAIN